MFVIQSTHIILTFNDDVDRDVFLMHLFSHVQCEFGFAPLSTKPIHLVRLQ